MRDGDIMDRHKQEIEVMEVVARKREINRKRGFIYLFSYMHCVKNKKQNTALCSQLFVLVLVFSFLTVIDNQSEKKKH